MSPTGEVNAVVGGSSRAVSVNFITDDGHVATDLTLTTDMTAVSGWSMAAPSFSCAGVGTGNGCQLHLTYAPLALGGGTLIRLGQHSLHRNPLKFTGKNHRGLARSYRARRASDAREHGGEGRYPG